MQAVMCNCGRAPVVIGKNGRSTGRCHDCLSRDSLKQVGIPKKTRREVSKDWKSWEDVPLVMTSRQVQNLLLIDRRTLDKMVEAGQIRRGRIETRFHYGRAAVRDFASRANCDPFEV